MESCLESIGPLLTLAFPTYGTAPKPQIILSFVPSSNDQNHTISRDFHLAMIQIWYDVLSSEIVRTA